MYCKIPLASFFAPLACIRAELFRSSFQSFFFFPSRFSLVGRYKRQVLLGSATLSTLLEGDKTQWNYEISLDTFIGIFSPCVSLETRTCQPSQSRQRKQNRSSLSLSLHRISFQWLLRFSLFPFRRYFRLWYMKHAETTCEISASIYKTVDFSLCHFLPRPKKRSTKLKEKENSEKFYKLWRKLARFSLTK